jgi:hypothetical protein
MSVKQPDVSLETPTGDFEGLEIEKLMIEINDKVLKSAGQIQTTPRGIMLVWKNRLNQQRMINIKALGGGQISVNEQIFPANKEQIRAAIVDALRNQVKRPVVS